MSSKWGSFFQQAVAGVEARLDNILAEEENAQAKPVPASRPSHGQPAGSQGSLEPVNAPRARVRIQGQTPKAISPKPVPRPASDNVPRPSSVEIKTDDQPTRTISNDGSSPHSDTAEQVTSESRGRHDETGTLAPQGIRVSLEARGDSQHDTVYSDTFTPNPDSLSVNSTHSFPAEITSDSSPCAACNSLQERLQALEAEKSELESCNQPGYNSYVERADALESKLKFLTREMTDLSRRSAATVPPGSLEKLAAEKNEKIALLMAEGQQLAATEQKHRTLMKKLRSELTAKDLEVARMQRDNDALKLKLDSWQDSQSTAKELKSALEALSAKHDMSRKELTDLRRQCGNKDKMLGALRAELEQTNSLLESNRLSSSEPSAAEITSRIEELEGMVASLEADKQLASESARLENRELQARATAAAEQCQQMKSDLQAMESRLEAMRMVAEESSSGATGDTQTKLLRQMETLQSQYTIASENWQRIEASFVSKLAALERERDEVTQRETETRKKAKDLASRHRRQSEELQQLKVQLSDQQREMDAGLRELREIRKRAEAAEAEVAASKLRDDVDRPNERQGPWLDTGMPEAVPSSRGPSRNLSPLEALFRSPEARSPDLYAPTDMAGLPPSNTTRQGLAGLGLSVDKRHPSTDVPRRTPSHGYGITASNSPQQSPRPSELPMPPYESSIGSTPGPFSVLARDVDDVTVEGTDNLLTPQQNIPDILSMSTVAAGPSVQLVERMSAIIRRLEAEKVANREELLRISKQRDEARAEISGLMKELESSRNAEDRVVKLEKEVAEMNERYQTTLELLGEKSELVEELRADVQDVKAMYRELVVQTLK